MSEENSVLTDGQKPFAFLLPWCAYGKAKDQSAALYKIMPVIRGKNIEVLFSAEAIARRNLELAREIASRNFLDLLVISILKGSFIFAADLIRALHETGLSPEVQFIFISSYGTGTVSGDLKVMRDVDADVAGRDVLLIDDILESG